MDIRQCSQEIWRSMTWNYFILIFCFLVNSIYTSQKIRKWNWPNTGWVKLQPYLVVKQIMDCWLFLTSPKNCVRSAGMPIRANSKEMTEGAHYQAATEQSLMHSMIRTIPKPVGNSASNRAPAPRPLALHWNKVELWSTFISKFHCLSRGWTLTDPRLSAAFTCNSATSQLYSRSESGVASKQGPLDLSTKRDTKAVLNGCSYEIYLFIRLNQLFKISVQFQGKRLRTKNDFAASSSVHHLRSVFFCIIISFKLF